MHALDVLAKAEEIDAVGYSELGGESPQLALEGPFAQHRRAHVWVVSAEPGQCANQIGRALTFDQGADVQHVVVGGLVAYRGAEPLGVDRRREHADAAWIEAAFEQSSPSGLAQGGDDGAPAHEAEEEPLERRSGPRQQAQHAVVRLPAAAEPLELAADHVVERLRAGQPSDDPRIQPVRHEVEADDPVGLVTDGEPEADDQLGAGTAEQPLQPARRDDRAELRKRRRLDVRDQGHGSDLG